MGITSETEYKWATNNISCIVKDMSILLDFYDCFLPKDYVLG